MCVKRKKQRFSYHVCEKKYWNFRWRIKKKNLLYTLLSTLLLCLSLSDHYWVACWCFYIGWLSLHNPYLVWCLLVFAWLCWLGHSIFLYILVTITVHTSLWSFCSVDGCHDWTFINTSILWEVAFVGPEWFFQSCWWLLQLRQHYLDVLWMAAVVEPIWFFFLVDDHQDLCLHGPYSVLWMVATTVPGQIICGRLNGWNSMIFISFEQLTFSTMRRPSIFWLVAFVETF